MVLDGNGTSRVWGWVGGGCADLTASLDGVPMPVRLDDQGLWIAELPAQPASVRPRELALRSGAGSTLTLRLRFGRVFFCTGQSCVQP